MALGRFYRFHLWKTSLILFIEETVQLITAACEVINGKWGNGVARKKKLTAAGYDYDAVQKRVNELMK